VFIAELLAVVITLVTRRISDNLFQDLVLISLFIQWIALASAAVLCLARRFLNSLPTRARSASPTCCCWPSNSP